jgi:hypothetical protein
LTTAWDVLVDRGMNQQAEALKARTAAFATLIIDLCSRVPQTQAGHHMTRQLIEAIFNLPSQISNQSAIRNQRISNGSFPITRRT